MALSVPHLSVRCEMHLMHFIHVNFAMCLAVCFDCDSALFNAFRALLVF